MTRKAETLVGVPFYEKEGQLTLDTTLKNIDDCLNTLDVDASIVVMVNGPLTAGGNPPALEANNSRYNAEISLVNSPKKGQVSAINDMVVHAAACDMDKVFITDADIYRFPDSLNQMWEQADKPLVGAHYRPYPLEVVEAEYGQLPLQEQLLYQIFDGDQSPLVRQILKRHGINRETRVKGSLMLLDVHKAQDMHDRQDIVSDSVINRKIKANESRLAEDAYFMHMGRVDMTDHIKARLRHYRGATARNDLTGFTRNQVQLPSEEVMNHIAEEIRETVPNGDYHAMLYLARCAIRSQVDEVCRGIVLEQWDETKLPELNPMSMHEVTSYADAKSATSRFFIDVDWADVQGFAIQAAPTTQEDFRAPIDLAPYLSHKRFGGIILESLGVLTPSGEAAYV